MATFSRLLPVLTFPLLVSSGVLCDSLADLVVGVQILDMLHALLTLCVRLHNGLLVLHHPLTGVSDALLLVLSACSWLRSTLPAVGYALQSLQLAMLFHASPLALQILSSLLEICPALGRRLPAIAAHFTSCVVRPCSFKGLRCFVELFARPRAVPRVFFVHTLPHVLRVVH